MGLQAVLMEHEHNVHFDLEGLFFVQTWKEIHDLITDVPLEVEVIKKVVH
jgi:hypothetical protein